MASEFGANAALPPRRATPRQPLVPGHCASARRTWLTCRLFVPGRGATPAHAEAVVFSGEPGGAGSAADAREKLCAAKPRGVNVAAAPSGPTARPPSAVPHPRESPRSRRARRAPGVIEPSHRGLGRLDPGIRRGANRSAKRHGSGGPGKRPYHDTPAVPGLRGHEPGRYTRPSLDGRPTCGNPIVACGRPWIRGRRYRPDDARRPRTATVDSDRRVRTWRPGRHRRRRSHPCRVPPEPVGWVCRWPAEPLDPTRSRHQSR